MVRHTYRFQAVLSSALVALSISAAASAATVHVDRSRRHQTLEGFGFFGAHDHWWGAPEDMVDRRWIRMVIDDLGLSMWRNEYYPPADANGPQDADWDKQRPFVEALRDQAAASCVPLKTLLTVWSAPAELKCASDRETVYEGTPHPDGTRNGGAVCPSQRAAFADWLIDGLNLYADIGVDVYGLSFQNEPLFRQEYNSGRYAQPVYVDTLAEIGPRIHAAFPHVLLFGSENLLEIETGADDIQSFDPFWYTANIMASPEALAELGAFAVHDTAVPLENASRSWANFHAAVADTRRPLWMTETSGYLDAWEGGTNADGDERPGAFALAQAIFTALYQGKASAWLWWQGSELEGPNEFSLMQGTTVGKRYYAAKHFYRFLRPGARMLETTSDDPEVMAAAFEHARIGNFVTIVLNAGTSAKSVQLQGRKLPRHLDAYVTSETQNIGPRPARVHHDRITLPPRSVTTLISGSYLDRPEHDRHRGPRSRH